MLEDKALDQIFRKARSHSAWRDHPIPREKLEQLYELMKFGPTSANCFPLRIVFVTSEEEVERLVACVSEGNAEKVRTAPVTAILAYDAEFYEKIPQLFPHKPEAREWFAGNPDGIYENALRNSSLQGAYFMIAARALGIDCGPMSGFDQQAVNEAFLAGTSYKSNFLCALGYGRHDELPERLPRPAFDEVCRIV